MSLHDLAGTAGALVLVLVLILLLRFGTRFLSARRGASGAAIEALGQLAIDGRRRLLLVRCGENHALVLSGGATDVLLSWPSPRPAEPFRVSAEPVP